MKRFEVGKSYGTIDSGVDPIKVLKRTDKMILVDNGQSRWKMIVRTDEYGNEFVRDCSAPKKWQFVYTYLSTIEE